MGARSILVKIRNEKGIEKINAKLEKMSKEIGFDAAVCSAMIKVKQRMQGEIFGKNIQGHVLPIRTYAWIEGENYATGRFKGIEFGFAKYFERDEKGYVLNKHFSNQYVEHFPIENGKTIRKNIDNNLTQKEDGVVVHEKRQVAAKQDVKKVPIYNPIKNDNKQTAPGMKI